MLWCGICLTILNTRKFKICDIENATYYDFLRIIQLFYMRGADAIDGADANCGDTKIDGADAIYCVPTCAKARSCRWSGIQRPGSAADSMSREKGDRDQARTL